MRRPACLLLTLLVASLGACKSPTKAPVEKKVPYVAPGASPSAGIQVPAVGHTVEVPPPGQGEPPAPATPSPASPGYTVTTLAGSGTAGFADGAGAAAQFAGPTGLAVTTDGGLLVADHNNHAIRRIDLATGVVSTVAGPSTGGSGAAGFADGAAAAARFNGPLSLAAAADGRVFIADAGNHRIRLLKGGQVSTLSGSGNGTAALGSAATAGFVFPTGIAFDGKQTLFLSDSADNRIETINATSGSVAALGGDGLPGSKDGGEGSTEFNAPFAVAADKDGNVIIAEPGGHRLRKLTTGKLSTSLPLGPVAGNNVFQPTGLALDAQGAAIVTDVGNHRVLRIPAGKTGEQVDTRLLAGGLAGDADGDASTARFNSPQAVAVGPDGTIYVADTQNNKIRKLTGGAPAATAASGATTP